MPTLSGSLNITGSINTTGSINVTGSIILNGNQIISGSINTTGPITSNGSPVITNTFSGSYATTGSNIFTGNQTISGSVVVTGSLTVSGSSTFTNIGPAIFQGPITASGDLRFPNTGSGVIRPINLLSPSGTGSFGNSFDVISTNSTTYLEYGINVVATGSLSNTAYCCRLPQTPQKGKSVTIINGDGADLFVFPSTASGDINGVVDGYFTVPPDGRSYSFDCYENPLPGGWSAANIPNGNTIYNSGIITYNSSTTYNKLAFVNQATKVSGSTTFSYELNGSNTLSPNAFGAQTYAPYNPTAVNSYILPPVNWSNVNNIFIRTNLTSSIPVNLGLLDSRYVMGFFTGTSTVANSGNSGGYATALNNFAALNLNAATMDGAFAGASVIYSPAASPSAGTFVPVGGNPLISSTVGGAGTQTLVWYPNSNLNGSAFAKKIGKYYITTIPVYQSSLGNNYNVDIYWHHLLSPVLVVPANITGVKFQMILNVTQ